MSSSPRSDRPRDQAGFVHQLPGGIRILVACPLQALVGHDAYNAVVWNPGECKSAKAKQAIERTFGEEATTAPISPAVEPTMRFLVNGPEDLSDAEWKAIPKAIRSRTRLELGISLILGAVMQKVVVVGIADDDFNL